MGGDKKVTSIFLKFQYDFKFKLKVVNYHQNKRYEHFEFEILRIWRPIYSPENN